MKINTMKTYSIQKCHDIHALNIELYCKHMGTRREQHI